jgi:hypothetical protein
MEGYLIERKPMVELAAIPYDEIDFDTFPQGTIFNEQQHAILVAHYQHSMSCFGMTFGEHSWKDRDTGVSDVGRYLAYLAACGVWQKRSALIKVFDETEVLVMPAEPEDGNWETFEWVSWRSKIFEDTAVAKSIREAVRAAAECSCDLSDEQIAKIDDHLIAYYVGWWSGRLTDASLEETADEMASIRADTEKNCFKFRSNFGLSSALPQS